MLRNALWPGSALFTGRTSPAAHFRQHKGRTNRHEPGKGEKERWSALGIEFQNPRTAAPAGFRLEDELLREGSHPRCEVTDRLLSCIDVLVDGRFVAAEKDISLQFRGSRNQRVLDLPKTLAAGQPVIWEHLKK